MINVAHQVPQFVRTDYPGFVDFLEAYYKWVEEEYGIGYFGDLIDIDKTIDPFLTHFRKELDVFGITNDVTSRFYIRHLKELYTAKGSSEAVKFLFKILYNKDSTIRLPWDYVAISSSGKWHVPFSFLLEGITDGQAGGLVGNEITVYDTLNNPYQTMVEYVNVLPSGDHEIFVEKIGYDRLSLDPILVEYAPETISHAPEEDVTSVSIVDSGEGFTVGEVFDIPYNTSTGLQVRIAAVDEAGRILAAEILSFGQGYPTSFNYVIIGPEGSAELSFYPLIAVLASSDILYMGAMADMDQILGDMDIVTADAGMVQHGFHTGAAVIYRRGVIANPEIPPLDNETIYYAIRVKNNKLKLALTYADALADTAIDLTAGGTGAGHTITRLGDAVLNFGTGAMRAYPGHYVGNRSVIGDGSYIQDSSYYQIYSYATIIEETLPKYKAILQSVLHPSGTKHFGEYVVALDQAVNTFQMDFETDDEQV